MTRKSGPKNSKLITLFITFAILFIVVFALGVIIGKGLGGSEPKVVDRDFDVETPEIEYGAPQMDEEEEEVTEFESEEVILDDENVTAEQSSSEDASTDETEVAEKEVSQAPVSTPTPEPAKPTAKPTAEPKQAEVKKTPAPQEKPKGSGAMPKIDPNGRFTVQIGAFQNQAEANKLVNSLKSNGYPAFIKQVETPDKKTWYRVRVGTFSTRSDALSYGDKLKQRETTVKSVFVTINN